MCFVTPESYNLVVFLLLYTSLRGKVLAIHNSDIFIDESLSNKAK